MRPRAIVLLSGGLDSTTCLAWAQARYECIALSFMYGQRSTTELDAARTLTQKAGVEHRVINIDLGNLFDDGVRINLSAFLLKNIP